MSTIRLLVLSLFLVVMVSLSVGVGSATDGADAAVLAIDRAQDAVVLAYEAVLYAADAGANVTDLLTSLNAAGALLVEAQDAYRMGDFDEAVRVADLCEGIGGDLEIDADEAWLAARARRTTDSWVTMTGSLVGVVIVVLASIAGWSVFKRRYYQRLLKRKPEVAG